MIGHFQRFANTDFPKEAAACHGSQMNGSGERFGDAAAPPKVAFCVPRIRCAPYLPHVSATLSDNMGRLPFYTPK
jgi:hypothetical protein